MTLKEAKRIVHDYRSVLARQSSTTGPAYPLSVLPDQPNRILQAMKLRLAHEIHRRSLSPEFRDEIGAAAANLAFFTPDEEARDINGLSTISQVNWTIKARSSGGVLQAELVAFIVDALGNVTAPDYWDHIYSLVGVERPVSEKTSFWKALWR